MPSSDKELGKYLIQILEQSKNGIVITDPNQENNPIIFVNQTTCDTFGYEKKDFLGRNCSFLQGEDKDQTPITAISKAINKQKGITTTVRNYTKDGKLKYNQLTISPIFDEFHNIKYFLGMQRDVTTEVELREQNEFLQKEQVENAQNSAIGKLSAGLSHEINTPLTIINGNMEMLLSSINSLSDSSNKEYMIEDIEIIQKNLNRIKNIVESMREISDNNDFESKPMNLYRGIIISLRLTFHKSKMVTPIYFQGKTFDFDIDRDKEKFMINGDYKKLEQVFISLIDNSLDQLLLNNSFDQNRLNIDIVENADEFQVIFQDNGGGMPEEVLKNIFKPFQGDKKHKGMGIGLCIVKKIIDQHKFKINISNENNGVKVVIAINKEINKI